MNQPNPLDLVSLFVLIAAAVFSREVAAVVGPYMVIILAAICGAGYALRRREKTTRASAAWFFVRVTVLAVLLTVALAQVVQVYLLPDWQQRWLLVPIALAIGVAGDDWRAIALWAWTNRLSWLDALVKLRKGG
jgi:predicted ABC-type exoprotein transport system permease subunit